MSVISIGMHAPKVRYRLTLPQLPRLAAASSAGQKHRLINDLCMVLFYSILSSVSNECPGPPPAHLPTARSAVMSLQPTSTTSAPYRAPRSFQLQQGRRSIGRSDYAAASALVSGLPPCYGRQWHEICRVPDCSRKVAGPVELVLIA